MSKHDFTVNVNLEGKGVSVDGFGSMLILDHEHKIPYTVITDAESLIKKHNIKEEDRIYKLAHQMLNQNFKPNQLAVIGTTGETKGEGTIKNSMVKLLHEAIQIDNDFFYIVSTDNSDETITELAKEVEIIEKMYATTTSNVELLDKLHKALDVKERVIIGCHNDDNMMGEKLAAILSGVEPGKTIGKFQQLKDVDESEYDDDERKDLESKGSFTYRKDKGQLYTSEGFVLSGEHIDVILGKYFIKFTLETRALELAIQKSNAGSKLGYSDTGIAALVAISDEVMTLGETNNILTEHSISYKARDQMSKKERQDRKYNGIVATGWLEGAIQKADFDVALLV